MEIVNHLHSVLYMYLRCEGMPNGPVEMQLVMSDRLRGWWILL